MSASGGCRARVERLASWSATFSACLRGQEASRPWPWSASCGCSRRSFVLGGIAWVVVPSTWMMAPPTRRSPDWVRPRVRRVPADALPGPRRRIGALTWGAVADVVGVSERGLGLSRDPSPCLRRHARDNGVADRASGFEPVPATAGRGDAPRSSARPPKASSSSSFEYDVVGDPDQAPSGMPMDDLRRFPGCDRVRRVLVARADAARPCAFIESCRVPRPRPPARAGDRSAHGPRTAPLRDVGARADHPRPPDPRSRPVRADFVRCGGGPA